MLRRRVLVRVATAVFVAATGTTADAPSPNVPHPGSPDGGA